MIGLKSNRKLSNYLVDKKLQLRYVMFVTVLSAVICGTLGFLIWQQSSVVTTILEQQVMEVEGEMPADLIVGAREEIESLKSDNSQLVIKMVAAGVGLVVVLSFFLVVLTHKVAGPLYKVTLYMAKMRDGRLDTVWPLRKGDMLQSFYGKFHSMHVAVRARHVECNEHLKEFVAELETAEIPPNSDHGHVLEDLKKHCEQRDDALA